LNIMVIIMHKSNKRYYIWVPSKTWKDGDVLHLTSMALEVPYEIALQRAKEQKKLINKIDKLRR
jgi:hypothetical protein